MMTKGSEESKDQWEDLKNNIVGLGQRSFQKSYYPQLQAKMKDLEKQRVFFQSILNSIPDGVVVMDAGGGIIQANPAFCRMFGYTNQELAGKNPALLYADNGAVVSNDECPTCLCCLYLRQDGTSFLGETLDSEVRDDQGNLFGSLKVIRDLTERIAAVKEQRQLEEQLRQSQKMAAIGTLAGGIAHDFNNLLAAILGYGELALLKLPPESFGHREVQQILKAGGKASELVNQILAFSRKETTKRSLVQPAVVLREALKLLRGTIPATITIHEQISATDKLIFANPTQLHQVIMNLATNAFHAMEERGGDMLVSLDLVRGREGTFDEKAEHVRIVVADNGSGIDTAHLDHIFEPYFTTKSSGRGTGMGLAVVHGIVESHGGRIEVESTPGAGTIFRVDFPVVAGAAVPIKPQKSEALAGGSESIMVVDDEPMVAGYLKTFLEQLGYRVTVCSDAPSALAEFTNNLDRFDLVITDHTMPGGTGFDMARTMLALRPNLPVILCSGYSSALSPERVTRAGIREFMTKPVSLHELAPLVRSFFKSP